MHNGKCQCHTAEYCTCHQPTISSSSCYTRVIYQKNYLLTKHIEELSGNKSGEWACRQEKEKTEKAMEVARRQEIVKWNQMTALDSRDSRERGDIRHPQPPFRETMKVMISR